MHVGEHAAVRVLAEVLAQPFQLPRVAAAGDEVAVRVEGNEVPGAEVVGVPALSAHPCRADSDPDPVPVVPVALRTLAVVVLMVADHRMAGRMPASPCGLV